MNRRKSYMPSKQEFGNNLTIQVPQRSASKRLSHLIGPVIHLNLETAEQVQEAKLISQIKMLDFKMINDEEEFNTGDQGG